MIDNVIEIRKQTEPAAAVLGRFYQVYEEELCPLLQGRFFSRR